MASLNNNYINQTYHGLIKTEDNGPIDGNLKPLTDGDGNLLPIEVSTDETKFAPNSTVDFTDVDVVGLSGIGAQGAQGSQGPTGITGAQGAQGTAGTNGAQGAQGPTGDTGAQGATGNTGAQGVQGPQGIDGVQGAQGVEGSQGVQGPQGIDGAQGAQGSGVQGAQGPQGTQGVSATGEAINDISTNDVLTGTTEERVIGFITIPAGTVQLNTSYAWMARINGSKVITNTTITTRAYIGTNLPTIGNTIPAVTSNFGVLYALSGPNVTNTMQKIFMTPATGSLNNLNTLYWFSTGTPSDFVGNIGSSAALQTVSIDWTVDQYITITGQLSSAVDSVFTSARTFFAMNGIGEQGEQGIDGAQGAQGPIGFQGFTGAQGNAGTNGLDGAQGAQGATGDTGAQGATGLQGFTGPQGNQGPQGTAGTDGISAGSTFYFNQSEASDVLGYRTLSTQPTSATVQTVTKNLTNNQQNVLVQEFITDELGFAVIPAGVQRFSLYYTIPTQGTNVDTYLTLQLADSAGVPYGPIITSGLAEIGYNAGNPDETNIEVVLPTTAISTTDRMICKLYLNNEDNSNRSVVWSTENGYYSFVITSVGVVGNQGPQGAQGPTGLQGFTGPQGNQGPIGNTGTQGPQGIDGAQGAQGSGTQGPQGAQGPAASGGGGLVAGTGTASMKNADSLVTTPAVAAGDFAIALGNNAQAGSQGSHADSIAIGNGAKTSSANQIFIGKDITNSFPDSSAHCVVISTTAVDTAFRTPAVNIGKDVYAAENGVAIGINAKHQPGSGGNVSSVAIGHNVVNNSAKGVAIGTNVSNSGSTNDGTIAIGANVTANANKAIVIGVNGSTCESEGISFGDNVDIAAFSDRSIGIGNAISIGTGTTDAVAIGTQTQVTAADAVAIGRDATSGEKSVSIGRDADATNLVGVAIGYNAKATFEGAVAMGANTQAVNDSTVAIGANAYTPTANSTAIGTSSLAEAVNTVAIGTSAQAGTNNATALGQGSSAIANNATALGQGVIADVANYTTTRRLQLLDYSVLDYADDTAAAAGGVPLGGIYHNAGALRIRIV
jgi:hypothetical protein